MFAVTLKHHRDISILSLYSQLSESSGANAAMSLLKNDPKTFSLLNLATQIVSRSVRQADQCWWTTIFRSLQQLDLSLNSGLTRNHHFHILAVRLGSLSCRKINHTVGHEHSGKGFLSRISIHFVSFIFPSIATSRPAIAADKQPISMMLPPPRFTAGMPLGRWWAVSARRFPHVPGILANGCTVRKSKHLRGSEDFPYVIQAKSNLTCSLWSSYCIKIESAQTQKSVTEKKTKWWEEGFSRSEKLLRPALKSWAFFFGPERTTIVAF